MRPHDPDNKTQRCRACGMAFATMIQGNLECPGPPPAAPLPSLADMAKIGHGALRDILAPRGKAREPEFQTHVTEAASLCGWEWYHTHDSRRSKPGFPDLVLVRERVVYAELKVEPNRPTEAQVRWADLLKRAGQEVYLWYPSDWPDILTTLAPV